LAKHTATVFMYGEVFDPSTEADLMAVYIE
jgi:hypothetical protein